DLARQLRDARGDGLVSEHARLGNAAFVHPVASSTGEPAPLWHSPGTEAPQSRQTDAANRAVSAAMGVANGGPYHAFDCVAHSAAVASNAAPEFGRMARRRAR